jgi:predicted RNase H-like HicB family nuclease/uncharacterized damage-inducible protein DinB
VGARGVSAIYVTKLDDGSFVATLPAVPGCAASGKTRDEAVERCRASVATYLALLRERDVEIEHDVVDVAALEVRDAPEPNTVPEDFTPVEEHDLRDFLHRFEALHALLLERLDDLTQEELERKPAEGEWSLREMLQHVAVSEMAFLSRLEPWPRGGFPMVNTARRAVVQRFSVMDAADAQGEHTILGRRWTTKKVMRRQLEHLFEHIQQAEDLLARLKKPG